MKLNIIGLGYIGLPTSTLFASQGFEVIGTDTNLDVVKALNLGKTIIHEPGLSELVLRCVKNKKLIAKTQSVEADAFIIAVPTPFFTDSKKPNLSFVEMAVVELCPQLKIGDLVVLESTSPVGTTKWVKNLIIEQRPDLVDDKLGTPRIHVAYCPERVLPGNILNELVVNERIVGGITNLCAEKAANLYRQVVSGTVHTTSAEVAEYTKLIENSYRDLNIAFANELSIIADEIGICANTAIELANLHPRVNILKPGCGVGGHCIAVDPYFLISSNPKSSKLIATAREVNLKKEDWVVQKIQEQVNILEKTHDKVHVALLGMAYKPNIDDLRESPAIRIKDKLKKLNSKNNLYIVEPYVKKIIGTELENLTDLETAIKESNIIVKLIAHEEFANIANRISSEKIYLDYS